MFNLLKINDIVKNLNANTNIFISHREVKIRIIVDFSTYANQKTID